MFTLAHPLPSALLLRDYYIIDVISGVQYYNFTTIWTLLLVGIKFIWTLLLVGIKFIWTLLLVGIKFSEIGTKKTFLLKIVSDNIKFITHL